MKLKLKQAWVLLVVLIVSIPISITKSLTHIRNVLNCPSKDRNPEIIVSPPSYTPQGYDIEEEGFTLICKAAYPVHWDFDATVPHTIEVKRIRQFDAHQLLLEQEDISCYEYILTSSASYGSAGNYTCTSLSDPSKSDSVYKYYTGVSSRLFKAPQYYGILDKIKLARKNDQNQYLIPCPSTYEKINATLLKINEEPEKAEISIKKGTDVVYDPKLGFMLNAKAFPDPTGKYKCVGRYGSAEYKTDYVDEVEVEIKMTDAIVSYYPEKNLVYFKNGIISLVCESVNEIQFETSGFVDTKIQSQTTNKRPGGHFMYSATIILKASGNSKGKVTCQMKDTNKIITSWRFDETTDKCRCLWKSWSGSDETDMKYGAFICFPGDQSKIDTADFSHCNNHFDCGKHFRCRDEDNCQIKESTSYNFFPNVGPFTSQVSFGPVKCTAEEFSKTTLGFAEVKKFEKHFETFHAHIHDMITIESAKTIVRVGTSNMFTCKINTYILVPEIKWVLKMKNGSVVSASSEQGSTSEGDHWYIQFHENSIQILDKNIQEVYCFASAWETGELKNSSVKILVLDSYVEVENPKKTGCENINGVPTILMRITDPKDESFKWYNVTNKEIVVEPHEYNMALVCLSPYLTDWEFNNYTLNEVATRFYAANKVDLSKPCYQNSITNLVYNSDIGTYFCRHLYEDKFQSSVYLYVRDDNFQLIDHGKHRNLTINKANEWTTIPCRVNDPSAIVDLIRQNYEGNVETVHEAPTSISFDPRKGFSVKTTIFATKWNSSDILICSSVKKKKEDIDTNHVITFSLIYGDDKFADGEKSANSSGLDNEGSGYALEAVIIPWLLLTILIICIVCLLIYTNQLYKRLIGQGEKPGLTIHFRNGNGNSNNSDLNGDQRTIHQSGHTNGDYVDEDFGGIKNPAYSKFN